MPLRLDPEVVRTAPQPRRAFQGWRYLRPEDAPRDLLGRRRGRRLPPALGRRPRRDRSALMRLRRSAALVPGARRRMSAAGVGGAKYNWDAIGVAFCQATLAGDMAAIRPLITDSLAQNIQAAAAAGNPAMPPSRVLFQTYINVVPGCEVQTRNAALVEMRRSKPGGGAVPGRSISSSSRRSTAARASTTCSSPPGRATRCAARLGQFAGNG